MNLSGLSIILGPFEPPLPGVPVGCNPRPHATVVNCTPPAGRSGELAEVLRSMPEVGQKLTHLLPVALVGVSPFLLEFPHVLVVSGLVIAPSASHPAIFELKSRLQGDPRVIPSERARAALSDPNCAGIDKYSQLLGEGRLVQDTVAITLGRVDPNGEVPMPPLGLSIPPIRIDEVRLAFYRDREFRDVAISDGLGLAASRQDLEAAIRRFFDGIAKAATP